jgi:hypothetical protein
MQVEIAHLRTQGIDFVVFNADARDHSNESRSQLLGRLMVQTRRNGLKVDKAALAYTEGGQTKYFGTPDLVRYLANNGVRRWTHRLDL